MAKVHVWPKAGTGGCVMCFQPGISYFGQNLLSSGGAKRSIKRILACWRSALVRNVQVTLQDVYGVNRELDRVAARTLIPARKAQFRLPRLAIDHFQTANLPSHCPAICKHTSAASCLSWNWRRRSFPVGCHTLVGLVNPSSWQRVGCLVALLSQRWRWIVPTSAYAKTWQIFGKMVF